MDELAATAKRPTSWCLIVNRLAVHLQNTGRATDHVSPNSRCSEAERIEDESISTPCAAPSWPPNYGERHAPMTQSGPWRLGFLEGLSTVSSQRNSQIEQDFVSATPSNKR